MNIVIDLEKKYNFQYPDLYKTCYANGFLNWGVPHKNWYAEVYPKLKSKPPLLVYANDFKIIDFQEIDEEMNTKSQPDYYLRINPAFTLVPFAKNGAGDAYCFFYQEHNAAEIPVVIRQHDTDEAIILAKNFSDFVFSEMLQSVCDIWDNALYFSGNLHENLRNFYKTHCFLLSPERQMLLNSIFSRPLSSVTRLSGKKTVVEKGLLTDSELENILIAEINFDNWKAVFKYTLPEPEILETAENKRTVGNLFLKISTDIPIENKLQEKLKALNWRQLKNETCLHYYRKGTVFFGKPTLRNLDETYREKLMDLKTNYPHINLFFQENESEHIFTLA